jgi:hypothetical protein
MKPFILILFTIAVFNILSAQEFVEVSYGASYSNQAYFHLEDNATSTVANTSWDIAFTTAGFQDAGIFINESASSMGAELELYLAPTDDFEEVIDENSLSERLLNDEEGWSYGAFNSTRAQSNPLDYGWGIYNPGTMTVEGTKVFVIKFRDGSYRKLEIVSLALTTYTFRHAELDGSDEVTLTLDKSNYPNTELAFFSLTNGSVLETIPNTREWDLAFVRYSSPLDDGEGGILDYQLTGVLSGVGVEVAQADGVNPTTVAYADYETALAGDLDIIGYDWKSFSLETFTWTLPDDRAYFVKTAEGEIYKIVFIDFEGSSTGVAVLEKTPLGTVNTIENERSSFKDMNLFPNPAVNEATLTFTLKKAANAQLLLRTATGQVVWSTALGVQEGFNVLSVPVTNLPGGAYFLEINVEGERVGTSLIVSNQ